MHPRVRHPPTSRHHDVTGPLEYFAPNGCARNRFTPLQRFAILFGVCFAVKYALRFTSIGGALQAVILAAIATALVWQLWSAGAANRRLMVALSAMLWLLTAVKVLRM